MLEYFGPRKRKDPKVPLFAYFEEDKESSKWSYIFYDNKELIKYEELTAVDLWNHITKYGTPLLWYSYDLPSFIEQLIEKVVSPKWIEERIPGPKGEPVEKFSLISRGGSDIIRMTIRREKERKRSKNKFDITLASAEPFYRWGPEELETAFNNPLEDNLANRYFGLLRTHEFIVNTLRVSPRVSLAGAALNSLQVFFIKTKIPRISEEIEDFIKPTYLGGMTELYKIYDPHCWGYDKNGLYAEAYFLHLPMKTPYIKEFLTPDEFMHMEDLGFVDVDVYIQEDLNKPPLPVRTPHGVQRLVGELESTREYPVRFFSEELKAAVRRGEAVIRKIHYGVYFKKSGPFLKDWALFTNNLKDKATCLGESKLAKECQNAIYGKFAQNQLRQITHLGVVPKERRKDPNITIISDDIPIWFEDIEVKLSNHLIHIASSITAWARTLMIQDARRLENEGITISYHDTDNWHLDKSLPPDLVGTLSGRYKCEFEDCEAFHFAPKMYFVKKEGKYIKQAIKGIPKKLLEPKALEKFIKDQKPIQVSWRGPQNLQEVLVKKFLYADHPKEFSTTLENRQRVTSRSFPGGTRVVCSILDLDTNRKQTSLNGSEPYNAKEVLPCRK